MIGLYSEGIDYLCSPLCSPPTCVYSLLVCAFLLHSSPCDHEGINHHWWISLIYREHKSVNLALLSSSRNGIEDVREDVLHTLSKLRTSLLEHNQISSSSLTDHSFSKLRSLQVLALSNNALRAPQGSWFRNTRGLTRLQLDGNQVTKLTDSSFGVTDLHSLRHLDLSNSCISYIGKDAFRTLPRLQEVVLPGVFTPLKQLILLSLDKNQWSCTCDLYPLAWFLRNYVKSSAHTHRNAKNLNCQPSTMAVATAKSVLRLSETNCNSKAANLTLALKDRSPLFPGQDVALLTVLGFAGMTGRSVPSFSPYSWSTLNDAFLRQLGNLSRACGRERLSVVWEDVSWFGIGWKNYLLQRNCLT